MFFYNTRDDFFVAKLLIESGLEVKVGDPILITVENESDIPAFSSYVLSASTAAIVSATESKQISTPAVPPPPPPAVPSPPVVPASVTAPPTNEKKSPTPFLSPSPSPSIPAPSSLTGLHFIRWSGTSSGGGALGSKLLSNQKAYNEKYGRSGNKLSSK